MNSQEAANAVEAEMQTWLGMDEAQTKAAVARAIAAMPDKVNDVDALRRVAMAAHREVMLQQAIRLTQWQMELERQGAHRFIDRVSSTLQAALR